MSGRGAGNEVSLSQQRKSFNPTHPSDSRTDLISIDLEVSFDVSSDRVGRISVAIALSSISKSVSDLMSRVNVLVVVCRFLFVCMRHHCFKVGKK